MMRRGRAGARAKVTVGEGVERGGQHRPEPLALPDGMEPQAVVGADLHACLVLEHGAGPLAQVLLQKLVVVHLAEEADALRVLALPVGQREASRRLAHLRLGELAHREHDV